MRDCFCHVEIATTDLERTLEFLAGMFGWKFQELSARYVFFGTPSGLGGGIEKVDSPPGRGGVEVYVHVDSIDESLEKAAGLGGNVRTPRTEIGGGHGYYAHVADPGGTVLGLWEPA